MVSGGESRTRGRGRQSGPRREVEAARVVGDVGGREEVEATTPGTKPNHQSASIPLDGQSPQARHTPHRGQRPLAEPHATSQHS